MSQGNQQMRGLQASTSSICSLCLDIARREDIDINRMTSLLVPMRQFVVRQGGSCKWCAPHGAGPHSLIWAISKASRLQLLLERWPRCGTGTFHGVINLSLVPGDWLQ